MIPLIRAEIVAEAVSSVDLPDEHCEQVWTTYLQRHNIDDDEQLTAHLQQLGFAADDLHWQLELPERVRRHSRASFDHKAEARFIARKEQLDRVVYSLLRVRDGYLARELYLRIAGREANFADLASEHSQGAEAKTKGIVGPVALAQAHPSLSEKLRTSKPGQLLEPFALENWWLVTRLERYEPARFDDKTQDQMAQELFQEWVEEELRGKVRLS